MAKFLVPLLVLLVGALAHTSKFNGASGRIVGGSNAPEGGFPYQISLRGASGSHKCGGSIIDDTTILTAAHCVNGASPSGLSVVVGTNQLNSGGTKYLVSKIRIHEEYNFLLVKNDIAILKLEVPITFTSTVSPILLETNDVGGGEDAVLSGWGKTSYPGNVPNDLQFINLKTITFEDCKAGQGLFPLPAVMETNVCTLTKVGEGFCDGDSGSPLVSNGKQIGIVSWGRPCALGKPDVFTRVSCYADWIAENRV